MRDYFSTFGWVAAVCAILALPIACSKKPEIPVVTPEVIKTVPIPAPKPVVCKKGKAGAKCRAHQRAESKRATACEPSVPGEAPKSWYERNTGRQP